ncbi:MAG: insulinase family protein [Bacteroidales bacterium]|nr:insulinase family protein [Bacteroidales bacterium]
MKRFILLAAIAAVAVACGSKTKYETVEGDPMQTRIYTLPNGLTVYMTVNKDEPRIQTYMPVRAGGKDDPADNTGLAHYLEHMMFKGTEQFGTQDYEAEKPMLAAIDSLFEVYRTLKDPQERLDLYHQIDSISYEASKIAIPNEYDKLMSIIGSRGSNAYTSNDVTCYVEEIPSNQIENWAKIEADRFKNCVFRGFHTELEAVYEEKNMGLTSDGEKAYDAIDSLLFPNHPYGTQTVIGTQGHLKNPSLKAIRKQKDTYYVPNNVAICLSGDLNPDETIRIIEKYFGDWKPNKNLPTFTVKPEAPITAPKEKHILGNEAEFILMGWRTPGTSSTDSEIASIAASVLYNGQAGLIDLDVVQNQSVLDAGIMENDRVDHGALLIEGLPKEGQTLEEVRDVLLAEVAKLRDGDFSEELVEAAKANFKLSQMQSLVANRSRASQFVSAFINRMPWKTVVGRMDRVARITKADVVAFAKEYLGPQNYAIAYKHIGEDKSIKKIDAPRITPIVTNRDKQSAFLADIAASEVAPIEPVFVDYAKDMTVADCNGLQLLYKKNEKNDIATLTFRYDRGSDNDPVLALSASYFDYLGTPGRSAAEIASEMYGLACGYGLQVGGNTTNIRVNGLGENLPKALGIVEDLFRNAVADEEVLTELKMDLIRTRLDSKKSQRACNSALQNYLIYGPEYVKATTLTNAAVAGLTSDRLLGAVKDLLTKKPTILYYGPASVEEVVAMVKAAHPTEGLEPLVKTYAVKRLTPAAQVILAPYQSRQFNYIQYSDRGEKLDLAQDPYIDLFNEYYGGGMNAIVFQEMRESRALAYSAGANLGGPSFLDDTYSFRATIASQNDKLKKAVDGFDEIIETLPQAPENLEIAKASILGRLRTQRVIGDRVLYSYLTAQELGLSEPRDKQVYEKVASLTMDDLLATHERWIKGRPYIYAILGDPTDLDLNFLKTLGPVQQVTLEEIFGY